MEILDSFANDFKMLTKDDSGQGYAPLRWQIRLFERFYRIDVPKVCDLPTGLGKTNVIQVWLLALLYQVSRREERLPTRLVYVVDRRTVVDQATALAERTKSNLASISLPNIPKNWLSVSTLRGQLADNHHWTMDLSRPAIIVGTVDMIGSRLLFSGYRSSYKRRPLEAGLLGRDALLVLDEAHLSEPFAKLSRWVEHQNIGSLKVMHMSATSWDERIEHRFTLQTSDLLGDRETNPILARYEAEKRLCIHEGVTDAASELIKKAVQLGKDGSRVVVFVRTPQTATKIAEGIRKYSEKKQKPLEDCVEVLTGTMRGWERDELLTKPVMLRFLVPGNHADEGPAILVSTSAGEVGFDLNADHLVCDAAPLDSMIQRLGRVNRRGKDRAEVHMFVEKPRDSKKGPKARSKHTVESASAVAIDILKSLPRVSHDSTGIAYDASPKALSLLNKPREALAPKPTTVDATDILLDAWSMTSIIEPMPGRPAVAEWLRGVNEQEPQTTIAWRLELDIDGFGRLDLVDIEEWLDAHRILSYETLSVPTREAAKWIVERWDFFGEDVRETLGQCSCVIECGGLRTVTLENLVQDLRSRKFRSIANADLTVPAGFGGIDRGFLKADSDQAVADVADKYQRHRLLCVDSECKPLLGEMPGDRTKFAQFTLELPSEGDVRRRLISLVPKRERLDWGNAQQLLDEHVGLVQKHARRLIEDLRLDNNEVVGRALELAAAWHDHGKDRVIWQRAAGHNNGGSPLGKSGGAMKRVAGDYRHEFGSLREFMEENKGSIREDVYELAMHMIATHHGRGRPHFPKGDFDPLARAKSPEIAADVVRRFAKLQRKYGHWQLAWLENLLRCADAMASAE
jgi:CRISPR-associated endonuclease/helicase Cas3